MDYPFERTQRYDVSNNWWFLPADLFKLEKDKESAESQLGYYPVVDYISRISPNDKFRFSVLIIAIIAFIYRLDFRASIWIGLIVGMIAVYYIHDKEAQQVNSEADELWGVLNSNLLKNTKYFITDPQLIKFVQNVGEFKKLNVLEFNQFVRTLDQLLRCIYDMRRGVRNVKQTLDIFKDLKVSSLNQFHSFIYKINYTGLRDKYNVYLRELGKILNDRHTRVLRIVKVYFMEKPVETDSWFDEPILADVVADDPTYDSHYNFYN